MGMIFGEKWQEPDWYSEQCATDVALYVQSHPTASDEEVVTALSGSWSRDGVLHALRERRKP